MKTPIELINNRISEQEVIKQESIDEDDMENRLYSMGIIKGLTEAKHFIKVYNRLNNEIN